MSEIYNQLGDAATVILVTLALVLRDDFRMPAWTIGIPGSLYTLRWLALDDTTTAVTAALLTATAITLFAWISNEPKPGGAR